MSVDDIDKLTAVYLCAKSAAKFNEDTHGYSPYYRIIVLV
jgi:hypothetical protein